MILLHIKDIKTFMNKLLVADTFDSLLLSEAVLLTSITYSIDGKINSGFYTDDELATQCSAAYSTWAFAKPKCFELIKGKKLPLAMKFVFLLDESASNAIIASSSVQISPENISGLFINIRYNQDGLSIITGTAVKTFTMDKSLDKALDAYVRKFLSESGIDFEEE